MVHIEIQPLPMNTSRRGVRSRSRANGWSERAKDMSILEGDSNQAELAYAQFAEVSSHLCRADVLVYALILCLGAFQFFLSCTRNVIFRATMSFGLIPAVHSLSVDFMVSMVIRKPICRRDCRAILGILGAVWGRSPSVFLRAMAVFGTLAFLASYELLRRQAPRIVAAAICLLLMSSMTHFPLVAQTVCPSYPYMFTTLSALLISRKLEEATSLTSRITWGALLATLLIISLLLASAAIAFWVLFS